jgi:hypothetical protein
MSEFTAPEIVPGVVARLDSQQLRSLGGSETNAQVTATEDRAVTDTRDFLVVEVDATRGTCMCLPLYNRSSPGSAPLVAAKREGAVEHWLTDDLHYSQWQHWRIPLEHFAAASAGDPGEPGARRTFARGDADTLRDLANWATRNRCAFRPA